MIVRDIVSDMVRNVVRDPWGKGQAIPEWMKLGWNLFQPDTLIGPEPVFSVASANYDEAGNNIGLNPRIDPGKGLWMGGQVANLFAGDSSQARSVTLTAQAYTLFVWSGSASCSYGAATPGNPLKFTATAGATVFTPTGVSKWLLVAGTFGDMPYVPPGATQLTNAATTGGNGVNIPLDAAMLECFRGKTDGVELRSDLGGMLDNAGTTHTVMSFSTTGGVGGVTAGPFPVWNRYRIVVHGYTTSSEFSVNAADTSPLPSSRALIAAGFGETEWVVQSGFQYFYLRNGSSGTTTLSSISIQRLLPAVCSAVDRFYFGFSSAQVSADTALRSVRNATTDVLYASTGGIIKSSDGTNTATVTVAGGWNAGQVISLYRRTNGTQMQVGYRKAGEMAITWGSLVAYDGSDNPGTHERCCLNAALPIWGQAKGTASKFCTDAELLEMEALAA